MYHAIQPSSSIVQAILWEEEEDKDLHRMAQAQNLRSKYRYQAISNLHPIRSRNEEYI